MPGETEHQPSGWTLDTLRFLLEERQSWQERFEAERDRRLSEIAVEREKALKIKETADLSALQLAREIQTYKDEKANELREQINRERGLYATKDDINAAVGKMEATMKPLAEYVARAQGRGSGISETWGVLIVVITILLTAGGLLLALTR